MGSVEFGRSWKVTVWIEWGQEGPGRSQDGSNGVLKVLEGEMGLERSWKVKVDSFPPPGRLLKCLKGVGGSVRGLQCHPSLPLVASCGLDRFLRIHSLDDKRLLHKVRTPPQNNRGSVCPPPKKKGSETPKMGRGSPKSPPPPSSPLAPQCRFTSSHA